jgi:Rrf2 family protein
VVHLATLHQNKGKSKKEDGTETLPSHKIAIERKVPDRFLLKVLKFLVGARILQSTKGPNGGYKLARPANEISMLEVVEAVEGPIRGFAPLFQGTKDRYEKEPITPLHLRLEQICNQVAEQTRKQLSRVKISDLAAKD